AAVRRGPDGQFPPRRGCPGRPAADRAHDEDGPAGWRTARASAERLAHAAQEGNPYVRKLLIQWVEGNPAGDR
ncbi:hypothetical protein ABT408_35010, partial [Streptomyces halstedii]|uniref:hypothetical protein n=1 Tax=Streptomyces halstedii TaxID=1944 RepID=UPI00335460EC